MNSYKQFLDSTLDIDTALDYYLRSKWKERVNKVGRWESDYSNYPLAQAADHRLESEDE